MESRKSSFRSSSSGFKGKALRSLDSEQNKNLIRGRHQIMNPPRSSSFSSSQIRKGAAFVSQSVSIGASRIRREASASIKESNRFSGQRTSEEELTDNISRFARETKQGVTRATKDVGRRIERTVKNQSSGNNTKRLERNMKQPLETKTVSRTSRNEKKTGFRKTSERGVGQFSSKNGKNIQSKGNRFSQNSSRFKNPIKNLSPDFSEGIRFLQGKAGRKVAEKAAQEAAKQGIKKGVEIAATTSAKAAATTANVASGGSFGAIIVIAAGVLLTLLVVVVAIGALVLIFFRSPMGLVFSFQNSPSSGYEISAVKSALTADMDLKLQALLDEGIEADPTLVPKKQNFTIDYKAVFSLWAVLQTRAGDGFENLDQTDYDRVKEAFYFLYRARTRIEVENVQPPAIPVVYLVAFVESNNPDSVQTSLSLTDSENASYQTLINYDDAFWVAFLGSGSGGDAGDFVINDPGLSQQLSRLPEGDAKTVLTYAASCLGWTYSQPLGGTVRGYHDCSSLVQMAAAQIGVQMPRTTWTQVTWILENGKQISQSELRPGDLIYWSETNSINNATHTGIYVGGGMIIDASSSRGKVVYRQIWGGQVLYARITS